MRKPTGPGKVSDNLRLPPTLRAGISALLFNFDFDDATLKIEHQLWLQTNAIPFLRSSPNARVSLVGTASRQGQAAYNKALSQRRVDAVKAFLQSQGTRPGQFDLISAVGEAAAAAAGKSDGTDDELDRAVTIIVRAPLRRGPVFFRRLNPFDRLDAFDQFGTPQWLGLPAFGPRRRLRLTNGEGIRLVVSNPDVVRLVDPNTNRFVDELLVAEDFQDIEFQGMLPGEAIIFEFDMAGAFVGQLEVTTLAHKEVTVAFHLIKDANQIATRKPETLDTMIAECNRVYNRQGNIFFKRKPLDTIEFPGEDLGDPVTPVTTGTNFSKLTARGDGVSRINTFLVWEWQRNPTILADTDARADDIPGRNVVFEDDAGTDIGLTFAHECAHCLGLSHTGTDDITDKNRLMWDFTDERGGLLIRSEITTVNAHVDGP